MCGLYVIRKAPGVDRCTRPAIEETLGAETARCHRFATQRSKSRLFMAARCFVNAARAA
jgi:hypothetical protein